MRYLLFLAAFLCACAPSRSNDDDSGATCTTELRVCATYGESAAAGSANVRTDSAAQPLSSPLGADGCVNITLDEGEYEWNAAHATDTCISAYEAVTVVACEVTEVSVDLVQWCFDG